MLKYKYRELDTTLNIQCGACSKRSKYKIEHSGRFYCEECLTHLENNYTKFANGIMSIGSGTKYKYKNSHSWFSLCKICGYGGHYYDSNGGPYETESINPICGKCLREKEITEVDFQIGLEATDEI